MELVEGGNFQNLISQYCLHKNIVKIFIAEMIMAFDYLHSIGIYHRDVKPENILITEKVLLKFNTIINII